MNPGIKMAGKRVNILFTFILSASRLGCSAISSVSVASLEVAVVSCHAGDFKNMQIAENEN